LTLYPYTPEWPKPAAAAWQRQGAKLLDPVAEENDLPFERVDPAILFLDQLTKEILVCRWFGTWLTCILVVVLRLSQD